MSHGHCSGDVEDIQRRSRCDQNVHNWWLIMYVWLWRWNQRQNINLIPFLWSIFFESKSTQNTTNLFNCQKRSDNPKWLILSTYIIDVCINIIEKIEKLASWNSRVRIYFRWHSIRWVHAKFKRTCYRWKIFLFTIREPSSYPNIRF